MAISLDRFGQRRGKETHNGIRRRVFLSAFPLEKEIVVGRVIVSLSALRPNERVTLFELRDVSMFELQREFVNRHQRVVSGTVVRIFRKEIKGPHKP